MIRRLSIAVPRPGLRVGGCNNYLTEVPQDFFSRTTFRPRKLTSASRSAESTRGTRTEPTSPTSSAAGR